MKRMLIAVAALLFSVATFAQTNDAPPPPPSGQARPARTPMSPEQKAKHETDKINALVALGNAYPKVLELNTKTETQRESIMHGVKRSDLSEDQKAQLKTLRENHKKGLEAAMGTDLYAKYQAAEKAKREERKSQGGPEDNK